MGALGEEGAVLTARNTPASEEAGYTDDAAASSHRRDDAPQATLFLTVV